MSKTVIRLLGKGDSVLNVTERMVAVRRANGDVDIIPLIVDEGPLRVDIDGTVTITYGSNTVETVIDGEQGNIKVITF